MWFNLKFYSYVFSSAFLSEILKGVKNYPKEMKWRTVNNNDSLFCFNTHLFFIFQASEKWIKNWHHETENTKKEVLGLEVVGIGRKDAHWE